MLNSLGARPAKSVLRANISRLTERRYVSCVRLAKFSLLLASGLALVFPLHSMEDVDLANFMIAFLGVA